MFKFEHCEVQAQAPHPASGWCPVEPSLRVRLKMRAYAKGRCGIHLALHAGGTWDLHCVRAGGTIHHEEESPSGTQGSAANHLPEAARDELSPEFMHDGPLVMQSPLTWAMRWASLDR